MHPGYVGADRLLATPACMAPDGLCLYHCLVAATDYAGYMGLTLSERECKAEELRSATAVKLREHGLSKRADRLQLSGKDGYPDEEDFRYIAVASGVSFEVDLGGAYVPHYGTTPLSARVLFRKIADGAGHLSDHYDLGQIYVCGKGSGSGRWRLWRKTPPEQAVCGTVDRPPVP